MKYPKIQRQISNRCVPPEDFVETIGRTLSALPDEVFAPNSNKDIYGAIRKDLGPWLDIENRRWAMADALLVLSAFESSCNWNQGRDTSNPNENNPLTFSAGAFQVSANSRNHGADLRAISPSDPVEFQARMKSDHRLAVEYIARDLRHTIQANGPVRDGNINKWLSRDAVAEWQRLFGKASTSTPTAPIQTPSSSAPVDMRSETNIATLHPKVQDAFRDFCRKANVAIFPRFWKWTSGTRSYAEQAKLYDAYVNHHGPKAAPPGHSAHQFGIGCDGTVFAPDGHTLIYEGNEYATIGKLGRSLGFHWGADFGDEPHFCKRPPWAEALSESSMMSELRRRHDKGIDVFA